MRILRLYYLLPPIKGGMEKHIYSLTKFQNEDHEVCVFFNQGDSITPRDKKIVPIIKFYRIRPLFIGVFMFYIAISVRLLFIKNRFDVIHIHGDWSSLIFVSILKRLTHAKKACFTCHGTISNSYQHRIILPKTLKNIDLVFATGHESAGLIAMRSNKEVIIQPSGINDVFFTPGEKIFNEEKFTVITVANLVAVKNLSFILEIARYLPEIEFMIAGDGPEKNMLENEINRRNLVNVKLLGFKSAEEVKRLYDESDCFLLTSLAEGTPTSALEAMARGLPIVSSNAGGIYNIVKEEVNGFVIQDFNANDYVEKLLVLKNNLELRKSIYNNNKMIARNFRWDIVAGRITSLTKECLYGKE